MEQQHDCSRAEQTVPRCSSKYEIHMKVTSCHLSTCSVLNFQSSSFIMYHLRHITVVAALFALSTHARRLHRRECDFTWPATTADTCATMAADWAITEALFKAINPGVECSRSLVEGQEYCVGWVGTPPSVPTPASTTVTPRPTSTPSRTTLATSTSTGPPSGPAPPSPVQSGITQNCQFIPSSKWFSLSISNLSLWQRQQVLSRRRWRYLQ